MGLSAQSCSELQLILPVEISAVTLDEKRLPHRAVCGERGVDPLSTFAALSTLHDAPSQRRPFNHSARLTAGFEPAEIDARVVDCAAPFAHTPTHSGSSQPG